MKVPSLLLSVKHPLNSIINKKVPSPQAYKIIHIMLMVAGTNK